MAQRLTVQQIRDYKTRGERVAMVTAYDATFARHFDAAGRSCCWSATRSAWSSKAAARRSA